MTKVEITQQALSLPEHERLELADLLWTSLDDARGQSRPVPNWQKQLLDERLAASAGEQGESWEQVRAEIWPDGQ